MGGTCASDVDEAKKLCAGHMRERLGNPDQVTSRSTHVCVSDRPPSTLPSFTPTDVYLTRHGCHIQNPTHLRCIRVRRFRRRRDVHRAKDFLAQRVAGRDTGEMQLSVHPSFLLIPICLSLFGLHLPFSSVQFSSVRTSRLFSPRVVRSVVYHLCCFFSLLCLGGRGNDGTSCFSCCRPFLRVRPRLRRRRRPGRRQRRRRRLTVWVFSLFESPSSLLLSSASSSSSTCLVRQSFLY